MTNGQAAKADKLRFELLRRRAAARIEESEAHFPQAAMDLKELSCCGAALRITRRVCTLRCRRLRRWLRWRLRSLRSLRSLRRWLTRFSGPSF